MNTLKALPSFEYEYAIKFVKDGSQFTSPIGKGFALRSTVEAEVKRLVSIGATNVKVFIRKW